MPDFNYSIFNTCSLATPNDDQKKSSTNILSVSKAKKRKTY